MHLRSPRSKRKDLLDDHTKYIARDKLQQPPVERNVVAVGVGDQDQATGVIQFYNFSTL